MDSYSEAVMTSRLAAVLRPGTPLVLTLLGCGESKEKGTGSGSGDDTGNGYQWALEGDDAGECADGADNDLDTLFDCDDPDCAGAPDCAASETTNYEPTQPVVAVSPEEPTENDDIACQLVTASSDPEGEEVSYSYTWTADDEATGITSETVQARFTGGDEAWACTVTPSDGTQEGLPATASVWVERINTPPTTPVIHIEPEDPDPDDDLACLIDEESTDAEDDPVTYRYAWTLDGVATSTTLSTVRASSTEEGQEWTCIVTPSDGREDGEAATASVEIPTCNGSALEFNGVSDYVTVPASAELAWGAAFSVEAWVWWGGDSGQDTQVIVDHGASPDYSFTLALAGQTTSSHAQCSSVDAGRVLFMVAGVAGSAKTCLKSAVPLPEEEWHHVAATYDAGDMYIFVDGVEAVKGRSGSSANDASDQDLYLGGRPEGSQTFLGVIDEVRLSGVARYTADFTPVTETLTDADTTSLWTFDVGYGTTVDDDSGNGHTGTITGATWAALSSCDAAWSR